MLPIFHDLAAMVGYAEFIRNSPPNSTALEDVEEDYFIHQILYIEHRFVSFPFDREDDGSAENLIETASRLACLLFIHNVLWGHYSNASPITRSPAMALRFALGESDRGDGFGPWAQYQDIYFWVVFIGAHSTRGQPEWPFFLAEVVKVAERLGLQTLEDARALLLGFFYTDHMFLESLKVVWDEIRG
jgi:hypothetical protein